MGKNKQGSMARQQSQTTQTSHGTTRKRHSTLTATHGKATSYILLCEMIV